MIPVVFLLLLTHSEAQETTVRSGARVVPLDEQMFEQLRKERDGKPLLLNVWATWCAPCIEEFPDLELLHTKYQNKADVVVVSIDYEDEVDTKVIPFLHRLKATMPAYINAFEKPLRLIETLDPEWSGAVPATFIYDPKGDIREKVIGKQSLASFEKLLRPYIAQEDGSR